MKTRYPMMTLCLILTGVLGGCGPEDETEGSHRFDQMTEQEMFVMIQDTFCAIYLSCPAAVSSDGSYSYATREECLADLDDSRGYEEPIGEEDRAALDACLSVLESLTCEELTALTAPPQPCDRLDRYLDLK